MLEQKIRALVIVAMQRQEELAKNILRLALGEIQRETSTKDLTEEEKEGLVRKLIKSNINTLELTNKQEDRDILEKENVVLQTLLPKEMTKEDVLAFINSNNVEMVYDNIGKSIGSVMKAMKESKITVNGKIVKEVVAKLLEA